MFELPLNYGWEFFYNYIYCFIFSCAGISLLIRLFSSCGKRGLLFSCGVWASHCGGFSGFLEPGLWGTQPQQVQLPGSRAQAQSWRMGLVALQNVGSSRAGTEPVSLALAGGCFTTEPPGRPYGWDFLIVKSRLFVLFCFFILQRTDENTVMDQHELKNWQLVICVRTATSTWQRIFRGYSGLSDSKASDTSVSIYL